MISEPLTTSSQDCGSSGSTDTWQRWTVRGNERPQKPRQVSWESDWEPWAPTSCRNPSGSELPQHAQISVGCISVDLVRSAAEPWPGGHWLQKSKTPHNCSDVLNMSEPEERGDTLLDPRTVKGTWPPLGSPELVAATAVHEHRKVVTAHVRSQLPRTMTKKGSRCAVVHVQN